MKIFKNSKGIGINHLIFTTVSFDFIILFLVYYLNNYLLLYLLSAIFVIFTIHQLYYLLLASTVKSYILEQNFIISSCFELKKKIIKLDQITEIKKCSDKINGTMLGGFGKKSFAFGKCYLTNVGTVRMFISNNNNTIIISTNSEKFAISPKENHEFYKLLSEKIKNNNNITTKVEMMNSIHKDKYFLVPFFISSALIIIYIVRPSILYITGELYGVNLPIAFNDEFIPVKWGTAKEFISHQLMYGGANMALLFCLYLTTQIYSKYDRKASYKYIYISLIIALIFFLIQNKILNSFI